MLTNLPTNAIKFTPANGQIAVRVERIGDEIRFAVSGTGMGIPSDQLEAVFVQFLQIAKNDRRGVGLGLYISKCIAQGHGGRIWAESRIGQGTTFCFVLPDPCRTLTVGLGNELSAPDDHLPYGPGRRALGTEKASSILSRVCSKPLPWTTSRDRARRSQSIQRTSVRGSEQPRT